LEILEFPTVYLEDKLIFNTHFRQILQSQPPRSREETHELAAGSPVPREKGFLCTCTEDRDKSPSEPAQVPVLAGGCGVPPCPWQTGSHPTDSSSPAAGTCFTSLLPPVSSHIASPSCRQLCLAVHCFATTVNTPGSSTHLTECFRLSPARADSGKPPKKLQKNFFGNFYRQATDNAMELRASQLGGSLALGCQGSRAAGFGMGAPLMASGL